MLHFIQSYVLFKYREHRLKKRLRLTISIIILIAVCSFVIGVYFPFRAFFNKNSLLIKDSIITYLEDLTDRKITLEKIEPGFLNYLSISNLTLSSSDGSGEALHFQKVKVYFDLGVLLGGDLLNSLNEIRLENSSIALDSLRDRDILDFIKKQLFSTDPDAEPVQFNGLVISAKNINISYTDEFGQVDLKKVFLNAELGNDQFDLSLNAKASGSFKDQFLGGLEFISDIKIRGTVDSSFQWASLRLTIPELETEQLIIHDQNFQFLVQNDSLKITKILDSQPIDLSYELNLKNGDSTIRFLADNYVIAASFSFNNSLQNLSPFLTSKISGNAEVIIPGNGNDIMYAGDLNFYADNSLLNMPVTLEAVFAGDSNYVNINNFNVTTKAGTVSYKGDIAVKNGFPMPEGILRFNNVRYFKDYYINGKINFNRYGSDQLFLSFDRFNVNSVLFTNGLTQFILKDNEISFAWQNDFDNNSEQIFYTSGKLSSDSGFGTSFEIASDNIPGKIIGIALPSLSQNDFFKDSYLNLDVKLTTDLKRLDYDLSTFEFFHPDASLVIKAKGNEKKTVINNITAAYMDFSTTGNAVINYGSTGLSFSSYLNIINNDYFWDGKYSAEKGLKITGNHGFRFDLFRDDSKYNFSLYTKKLPVRLSEENSYVSANLYGWFININNFLIRSSNTSIFDLPIPMSENKITFSGIVDDEKVLLNDLVIEDSISAVQGIANADISIERQKIDNVYIVLNNSETGENYSVDLELDLKKNYLDSLIKFDKTPFTRFPTLPIAGNSSGLVTVAGELPSPEVHISVKEFDAWFDFDIISGQTAGTADLLDLLNSPDIKISFDEITGKINHDSLTGTLLASAKMNNPQDDPELFLKIEEFLGELNLPFLRGGLNGNAEIKSRLKQKEVQELTEIFKNGIKAQAVRKFINETVDPEDPLSTRIRTVMNLTNGQLQSENLSGKVSGMAAVYSNIKNTELGFNLQIEDAAAEYDDLSLYLTSTLTGGAGINSSELAEIINLLIDGINFEEALDKYFSADFIDLRTNIFANLEAERFAAYFDSEDFSFLVDGSIDVSLLQGLLSFAAEGADLSIASYSDDLSFRIPGKVDISGSYDSDELLAMAEFMKTVSSVKLLQKAVMNKKLPSSFWDTYFSILVKKGIIELSAEDYHLLAFINGEITGNLGNLEIDLRPQLSGQLGIIDENFNADLSGYGEISGVVDNRVIGTILGILSKEMELSDLNTLFTWVENPELFFELIVNNGEFKDENFYIPFRIESAISSNLKYVNADIEGFLEDGSISSKNFSAVLNGYLHSKVQSELINFNAVLEYLSSAGSPSDLNQLINSMFVQADSTTKLKFNLSKGLYSDGTLKLPLNAEFSIEPDIQSRHFDDIFSFIQNPVDYAGIIRDFAGTAKDSSILEVAESLALLVIDNEFKMDSLDSFVDQYPELYDILNLQLNGKININNGRITLPWLDAFIDVYAEFSGQVKDFKNSIQVSFRNTAVRLNDFIGTVNADLFFKGSLEEYTLSADIGDTYGLLFGRDVSVSGSISSYRDDISFKDLNLQFDVLELRGINGNYSLKTGFLETEGFLDGGFSGYPLAGDFVLSMQTAAGLKRTDILDIFKSPFTINTEMSYIKVGEEKRDFLSFQFEKNDKFIKLTSSNEYLFSFQYDTNGDISAFFNYKDSEILFNKKQNEDVIESELMVKDFSLAFLQVLRFESYGLPFRYLSEYTLDASAVFRQDVDLYSFTVPKLHLAADENRVLDIKGHGNTNEIVLESFEFQNNEDFLNASLKVNIEEDDYFSLNSELSFNKIDYTLAAAGTLADFNFTGSYGLSGSAGFSGEHIFFNIDLIELPLAFDSENYSVISIHTSGEYVSPDQWSMKDTDILLSSLPLLPENNVISISGKADSYNGVNMDLSYTDYESELSGVISINNRSGKSIIRDSDFTVIIGSSNANENYTVSGAIDGNSINAKIIINQFPLNRIPGYSSGGEIDTEILFNISSSDVEVEFSMHIANLLLLGSNSIMNINGKYKDNKFIINDSDMKLLNYKFSDVVVEVDTLNGSFDITSSASGVLTDDIVTGDINISGRFDTPFYNPSLFELLYSDIVGNLDFKNLTVGSDSPMNWYFSFSKTGKTFKLDGGPENGISGEFRENGEFDLSFSEDLPFAFKAGGTISGSEFDARIIDINLEIGKISRFLNIPFIEFTGGNAVGDLRITGRINDPDFYGELTAEKIYLKCDFVNEELGPADTTITFNEKELQIPVDFISSSINQISVKADFIMEQWLPSYFNLEFETLSNTGVHINIPVTILYVDGYAIGKFSIDGDSQGAELNGDLHIFNCNITQGEKSDNNTSKSDFDTLINLAFTTGRNVTFRWPRTAPILTASAKTGQKLKVFYDSASRKMNLKGELKIQSGTVLWWQQSFYIRSGQLEFNETETLFDPKITARAELFEKSSTGESVRIYLELEKDSLNNLNPGFSSKPYLSGNEIASILGRLPFADPSNEFNPLETTLRLVDPVVDILLIREFEKKVEDILNLDLFSIRTQLIQNALLQKVFSSGDASGSNGSIGKYLDNTTIFFGKHLSDDVYLEALVRINTNDYNAVVSPLSDLLIIQSELNLEWRTELFNFDISIEPDITSLDNTVNSIDLGLSWNFQF